MKALIHLTDFLKLSHVENRLCFKISPQNMRKIDQAQSFVGLDYLHIYKPLRTVSKLRDDKALVLRIADAD